jgi:hypothetical protein
MVHLVDLLPLFLVLPLLVLWALMFRDMMNNDYLPNDAKVTWLMVFIFLNVLGAILYYFTVYRKR